MVQADANAGAITPMVMTFHESPRWMINDPMGVGDPSRDDSAKVAHSEVEKSLVGAGVAEAACRAGVPRDTHRERGVGRNPSQRPRNGGKPAVFPQPNERPGTPACGRADMSAAKGAMAQTADARTRQRPPTGSATTLRRFSGAAAAKAHERGTLRVTTRSGAATRGHSQAHRGAAGERHSA